MLSPFLMPPGAAEELVRMTMFRTKPIEARRLDFAHPHQVADIEHWCGGKVFGRKLMVNVEGSGDIAYDRDYVVKTASGKFTVVAPAIIDSLFEEVPPRA